MSNSVNQTSLSADDNGPPLPMILLVEDNPLPIMVVSADAQQPQLQAYLGLGAHQVHEKSISLPVLGRAL